MLTSSLSNCVHFPSLCFRKRKHSVTRFSDVNIALQDQEYSRADERLFCETAPRRHLSIRSTQSIPGSVSTQFIPGSLSALVMMPRRYFHAATRTTRLPLFWLEHFEYDLSENILSLPLWRPSPGLCLEKMEEDLGKCNERRGSFGRILRISLLCSIEIQPNNYSAIYRLLSIWQFQMYVSS